MVQSNHGLRLNLKRDQERIERQLLQGPVQVVLRNKCGHP